MSREEFIEAIILAGLSGVAGFILYAALFFE
jgi:hypothetical protein